ncbi:MAG: TIGR02221 family CRISPR-associated protein [Magnetococcales bacterium]|nr:TIGR02221 family CRISPR-associated protein [Magnetococcales bacterium]
MKVLISFLGKSSRSDGRYRETRYRFDDGDELHTAYFGMALAKKLQPDRLVLLGTRGSMWDVLFEDLGEEHECSEERLALIDEVSNQCVCQERLDRLAPLLERHVGVRCLPRIIPFGRDGREQTEILSILAADIAADEVVSLDLTHGLRHLPMLGLLSALYLRTVKRARIDGLYYGAMEMRDDREVAPVVRLDGLLQLADWIGAVDRYDQSGDYGVFAPLLGDEGSNRSIASLRRAAFYERASNVAQAQEQINTFNGWFERETDLSPAARLFREALKERINWASGRDRADCERQLAWDYLKRRDYPRATMFGFEALISDACHQRALDNTAYRDRDKAKNWMLTNLDRFKHLKDVRNALAHGVRSEDAKVAQTLASEESLQRTLEELFNELLGSRSRP